MSYWCSFLFFLCFFSSRRRHTRYWRDWSSDVCSSDVVTPNSDTPYSFLWMDLRAEPIIVTMPKIEKNRYYTGQLVDLYTYNFAYLGTRSYGNDGSTFMIAGPGCKGETPKGVTAVMQSETQ